MEGYIGEIRIFDGSFAPQYWMFCEGQILPINSNQALFSIITNTYGGDGRVSFALPDLKGKSPAENGALGRYIICVRGIYPSRP